MLATLSATTTNTRTASERSRALLFRARTEVDSELCRCSQSLNSCLALTLNFRRRLVRRSRSLARSLAAAFARRLWATCARVASKLCLRVGEEHCSPRPLLAPAVDVVVVVIVVVGCCCCGGDAVDVRASSRAVELERPSLVAAAAAA